MHGTSDIDYLFWKTRHSFFLLGYFDREFQNNIQNNLSTVQLVEYVYCMLVDAALEAQVKMGENK